MNFGPQLKSYRAHIDPPKLLVHCKLTQVHKLYVFWNLKFLDYVFTFFNVTSKKRKVAFFWIFKKSKKHILELCSPQHCTDSSLYWLSNATALPSQHQSDSLSTLRQPLTLRSPCITPNTGFTGSMLSQKCLLIFTEYSATIRILYIGYFTSIFIRYPSTD